MRATLSLTCLLALLSAARADDLEWVRVGKDGKGFVLGETGRRFVVWGLNYDRDEKGRLLEDYWESEWSKVEKDFRTMKRLGANVVRVHLQFGRFMDAADRPNRKALARLNRLLKLAEKLSIYLDVTGLGCYHKKDVPAWYDELAEQKRWQAQSCFWGAVAKQCASSPAVFCYDLMNEPVVPGGKRKSGDWLGGAFAGKHYVQFITLDQKDRERKAIARQWVTTLAGAIRKVDRRHLITVGLVDWSLDGPGLTSGFVPKEIVGELDFLSVHIYPRKGEVDKSLKTLAGFSVGKPVLVEETFPLHCSSADLERFIDGSGKVASGWMGFYWGHSVEELKRSKKIEDALILSWLELFRKKGESIKK